MEYRIKKVISNEYNDHSKYYQIQKRILGIWFNCTFRYGSKLLYFNKTEAKQQLKRIKTNKMKEIKRFN